MATYHRRSRTRSILVVAVLAAITLIVLDTSSNGTGATGSVRHGLSDAFSPLQRATHAALAPVGDFLTGAADYGSLRRENQRLRNELASGQAATVAAQAARAAADRVLAQAHLPFVSGPTVVASVVDRGASNFEDTVTIDKGTDQGIAVGQAVVAPAGLVGQIASASTSTSTVELLTDPTFVVGVNLSSTVIGSAQGTGRGSPLRVTFDEAPTTKFALHPGQELTTSGGLDAVPAGIPLATVRTYATPPGTEPTVTLNPIVNMSDLSYVTVQLQSTQ